MRSAEKTWSPRIGVAMVLLLVGVGLADGAPIDDFNDKNDSGWTHIDRTVGEPWDPPTYDASSGSYHLVGGGVVPVGTTGSFGAAWSASSDPHFSDGFVGATVRANNSTTLPALTMRFDEDTSSWYLFAANPVTGRFAFDKFVDGEQVFNTGFFADEPFLPGQDWMIEAGVMDDELSMKVWRVGQQKPVKPQWSYTDTPPSLAPGQLGVVAFHWSDEQAPEGIVDATFDDVYFTLTPDIPENALQAGDANQDLSFDQMDLVEVLIAGKYMTGEVATWGEGDWDGAPGGEPGSPPPGNGLFDQFDIVGALANGKYLAGRYAAVSLRGQTNDDQTSVIYNAITGEMGVDAPAATQLTSINIDSASGIFTGNPAQNLGGSFDNDSDTNIFKATFGTSFGSLTFGPVAQPGLSQELVAGDLTVVGSLQGGGDLGPVDLVYVPEPMALALLVLGLTGMLTLPAWNHIAPSSRCLT